MKPFPPSLVPRPRVYPPSSTLFLVVARLVFSFPCFFPASLPFFLPLASASIVHRRCKGKKNGRLMGQIMELPRRKDRHVREKRCSTTGPQRPRLKLARQKSWNALLRFQLIPAMNGQRLVTQRHRRSIVFFDRDALNCLSLANVTSPGPAAFVSPRDRPIAKVGELRIFTPGRESRNESSKDDGASALSKLIVYI